MRKIKRLLCVLLSCFCIYTFSGCALVLGSLVFHTEITALVNMLVEKDELPFELVRDFTITDVEQEEDAYVVVVSAAVKNLGEDNSDAFQFDLSFYDEGGKLLGTESDSFPYVGKGETMVMQRVYTLQYKPASVKAENLVMYAGTPVCVGAELAEGENFQCVFNKEDGKYHTTVCGEMTGLINNLGEGPIKVTIYAVLYGTDGCTYLATFSTGVSYQQTKDYVIEYVGDVEITDYKLLK